MRRERGFLLITLAVTIPLSGIVLAAYADRSLRNLEAARRFHADVAALHNARAGIEKALWTLSQDPDWRDGFPESPLGQGSYSVTVEDETTLPSLTRRVRIRATGKEPGSRGSSVRRASLIASTHLIRTVVGTGGDGYNGDGLPGPETETKRPHDLVLGPDGRVWFSSQSRIRRYDPETTLVDTPVGMGFGSAALGDDLGDGGPAHSARFNDPRGISFTPDGKRLYIADSGNGRIRLVNYGTDPIPLFGLTGVVGVVNHGEIGTIAGASAPGFGGDGFYARDASFGPIIAGATADGNGIVFVADTSNDRIRAVNTNLGPVTVAGKMIPLYYVDTIYGNGTQVYGSDGAFGHASGLDRPGAVKVDGAGDIWVPIEGHGQVFRLLRASGIIRHEAGRMGASGPGDGSAATLAGLGGPTGLDFRPDGSWILASRGYHTIRGIDPARIIDTVAGKTSVSGYHGDGGPPTAAELDSPLGVAADPGTEEDFYFTDQENHRIRQVLRMITVTGYTEG